MAGASFSTNTSTGQSTSTSTPVQTPQSEWGLQLSQLLQAISDNQYQWAHSQFDNGMGITNQNINNYMRLAGNGEGLAQNLIKQYSDTIAPLIDSYVKDAGTFSSEGRQRFMAGQAESTVAQADQAGRDAAERKLQGFGINPNSGRYQDLMLTSRIQDAAARAGAGTQAALDTADRGRAMKEKAIGMGQNMPGMAVNALQSAYSGVTGAENAILGMLNTGANITSSAAPFANAASGAIKMPSQGTQAQSNNNSRGQSQSATSDPARSNSDKGGQRQPGHEDGSTSGGKGGGAPTSTPINPRSSPNPFYNQQPGSKREDVDGNDSSRTPAPMPYFDEKGNLTPYGDPNTARDPSGNLYTPESTPWNDLPQVQNWAPQQAPGTTPGQYNTEPNAASWNPNSPTSPTGDFPDAQPQQQPQSWDQPQQPFDNFNYNPGGNDQSSPWEMPDYSASGDNYQEPQWDNQQEPVDDYGYQPQGPNNFDEQDFGSSPDYNFQPQQGGFDDSSGGGYSDDDSYARGGRVRPRGPSGRGGGSPTSGGAIPQSASPSRGRQVDDVKARVNVGEFVVPRDVVAHKGNEFFTKLIAQSRKARTGMAGPPPRAKMRPPLPDNQPTTFRSRPMGAR